MKYERSTISSKSTYVSVPVYTGALTRTYKVLRTWRYRTYGWEGMEKSSLPFQPDNKQTFLVRLDSGGFLRRSCTGNGGDVVDFHMQLNGIGFVDAAKDLDAHGNPTMTETAKWGRSLPVLMVDKACRSEALHEFPSPNVLLRAIRETRYGC